MKIIFLAWVLFLNTAAFADGGQSSQTTDLMQKFLVHLSALKTYMVSEEKFIDPKNSDQIALHLKEFAEVTKKARHDPSLKQENFKFSNYVLDNHIAETERVFRAGNKPYARWMLNSTVSLCMSCHSQFPVSNRAFEDFTDHKMFSSQFDQAEFLFATRVFDKAFAVYNKLIEGYPKNNITREQLEAVLKRQVAYFSRVKREPKDAIAKLRAYADNKKIPQTERTQLQSWIKQFQQWNTKSEPDPKTATDAQILEFARKNVKPAWEASKTIPLQSQLVTHLRVSGILFEYLNSHPQSKAMAEILFWLSICDRSINNSAFYSFADLYLRECIIRHTADPIAKKCYQEYEAETILGYTGSGGTSLPEEVQEDLNQLKRLVEKGGKVDIRER